MKFSLAKALPHFLCIIVIYAITIIYFKPEFFDNKQLIKSDIVHYEGGAKETKDYNYNPKNTEPTLWTGSMFGGMPVYLLQTVFYDQPLIFFDHLFKGQFFNDGDAKNLFILLIGTYLGLLCFGVSPYLALLGAVSFALSTYNLVIIGAGHLTKVWAIAYAPLVLGSLFLTLRSNDLYKKLLGLGIFSLSAALELRAGHPQISYYLAFICIFLGISELYFAIKENKLKTFALSAAMLVFGAVLAVGTSAGKMLITAEYSKYSTRGKAELSSLEAEKGTEAEKKDGLSKEYAFGWSQGKVETLTLLIPNLYGGASGETIKKGTSGSEKLASFAGQAINEDVQLPTYWGEQPFTSAPVYAGAVVCFLFVLGLLFLENRQKYWFLAGFVLMCMLSWGNNLAWFNYTLFDYFPGFNKFRSVSMALSLAVMLMAMFGVLGLDKVLEEKFGAEAQKKLLIAFGTTGGFALFLWLMGTAFFDFSSPNDDKYKQMIEVIVGYRKYMFKSDALRSAFFIVVAAAAIWLVWKNKISQSIALAVIGLFSLIDLWGVGKRYLGEGEFQENVAKVLHQPTPADNFILQDKDLSYRVLNFQNPFNDAETSYFHKSVGGYFAAKMRRYQELYERQIEKQMQAVGTDLKAEPKFENYTVLNMLNARYFKFGNEANSVLKNPAALGNAWFVNNLQTVNNADEEMAALDKINTKNTAVIDVSKFKISANQFVVDSLATAKMTVYTPKEVQYETNNTQKGFLVFSEIYYPEGWEVTIDEQAATPVRVNYVLRGLEIPAGKHKIRMVFNPSSYQIGSLITKISAILVGLLLAVAVGLALSGKTKVVV
jgi:hypothetical protein